MPSRPEEQEEPKGLLARFNPRRIHRGKRVGEVYLGITAIALTGGLTVGLSGAIMKIGHEHTRRALQEACGVLARGDQLTHRHMQAFHTDGIPFLGPEPATDDIRTLRKLCWRQAIDTSLECIAQAVRRSAASVENMPLGLIGSAQNIQRPCGTEGPDKDKPEASDKAKRIVPTLNNWGIDMW